MAFPPLLIAGLIGAGAMYFLDPRMGNRRRALLRDQFVKLQNTIEDQADVISENVADRAKGAAAELNKRMEPQNLTDETLVARVRSEMGRYVSHPGAIDVLSYDGQVTLKGHILTEEAEPFMQKVRNMPGVKGVHNQLQMHKEAGNIPDLQGGKTRTELS